MIKSHRVFSLLILLLLADGTSDPVSAQAGQPEAATSATGNLIRTCIPSTLAGYSCMLQVLPKIYHLHWTVHPLKVSFAIEAQTQGWAALAWSPDGGMPGSNAVVGFATGPNGGSGSVGAYNLGGFTMFQVVPSTTFSIQSPSVTNSGNGTSIIRFYRLLSDVGDVPWNTTANLTALYAFSDSPTLGYHGFNNRGSFKVVLHDGSPLAPNRTDSAPPSIASQDPSPSGSGSTCEASTRVGYVCQRKLQGDKYILHWNQTSAVLRMAVDVATSGWASIGWSPSGSMKGSDVVIANVISSSSNTQAPLPYHLSGYKLADVQPSTNFSLGNAELESSPQNGRTTFSFERSLVESGGSVPLVSSGSSSMIWAYSPNDSQALESHRQNKGHATINVGAVPTSTAPTPSPSQSPQSLTTLPAASPSESSMGGYGISNLGYKCATKLQGGNSNPILHWTNSPSNLSLALEATTDGWLSLGFSPTGGMADSIAIISSTDNGGSAPSVGPYFLGGYTRASITPASNAAISGAAISMTNGISVIKYSLQSAPAGPQHVIWALSPNESPSLTYHGENRGSALIDFSTDKVSAPTDASAPSRPPRWVVPAHGLLMGIAFVAILPFGVLWPAFGKMFATKWWFWSHVAIQVLGVAAITVGAILSIKYLPALDTIHGQLGLAIIIAVWIQPLLALARPHPSAKLRRIWFSAHWVIGIGAIVAGWVNVFIGLNLYVEFHGKQQTLWTIIVVLLCFFGALYVISLLFRIFAFFYQLSTPSKDSSQGLNKVEHGSESTMEGERDGLKNDYDGVENFVGEDEEFRWTKAGRRNGVNSKAEET